LLFGEIGVPAPFVSIIRFWNSWCLAGLFGSILMPLLVIRPREELFEDSCTMDLPFSRS